MPYTEIKAVAGVRNDLSSDRFDTGDLLYARNIDLDESGRAQRRLGSSTLYVGPAHSLFSYKNEALLVQGGQLKRFIPGNAPVALTAVGGRRVAYVGINDSAYWTDGRISGVVSHGVNKPWGIVPPVALVPAIGVGSVPPGTYLCTMTYVTSDGVESGAPASSSVTFASSGAIVFNGLSVSTHPDVISKNIYLTTTNGDTPLLSATIPNSATTASVTDLSHQTMPVRTQFKGPPPAGQVLGRYNGRAYVASGQFLWYSEPYEYELFDQRSGFLAFPENIQTFAAVADGVFLGTVKRTVFLRGGGPDEFVQVPISPVGTIMGTEVSVPKDAIGMVSIKGSQIDGNAVLWASQKGPVLGTDGGSVKDLTIDRFIPPPNCTVGGALLKWRNGTPQYVVSLFS